MNHEINRIKDEPAARLETFAIEELDFMILERFLQVVSQGLQVRIGGPGCDDEAIGKGRGVPEIKELEVHCFFVEQGFACDAKVLSQFRVFNGQSELHGAGEGWRRLWSSR